MKLSGIVRISFLLSGLTCANAQNGTLKSYFQQLPTVNDSAVPSYEQLLSQTDQIAAMPANQLADALPAIFSALKSDGGAGIQAAFALSVVSRRADASVLLDGRLAEIGALLGRNDPRLKATASTIFVRMSPPPAAFAVPLLANAVAGLGAPSDRAQALWGLVNIAPGAPETEKAILYMLGSPLDKPTKIAVLQMSGDSRLATNTKIIAAVAQGLDDGDEAVLIATVQSLGRIGTSALALTSGKLAALSTDESKSSTVRRLANNALQQKNENCLTLLGNRMAGCPAK
jgi:hypothetical protein